MTLSGMRAPNKQKFWPARNWTATDGTVGRPSGWTGVSVSNRMRVVSRHLSSHSTQLRSWGHETLWSWPRARFAKRENRSKITSCRSKAYWTAQLGRWTVRPPAAAGILALHREREPTGFLWDGYGAAR